MTRMLRQPCLLLRLQCDRVSVLHHVIEVSITLRITLLGLRSDLDVSTEMTELLVSSREMVLGPCESRIPWVVYHLLYQRDEAHPVCSPLARPTELPPEQSSPSIRYFPVSTFLACDQLYLLKSLVIPSTL